MAGQPSRRSRQRPVWQRLMLLVFDVLLVVFFVTLLYAALLRVMPVPGTVLMVERAIAGENVRRMPVPLAKISPIWCAP